MFEVAIQTFNLAGRLAFNLRDHAGARQFAADADEVSSELHDGWMKQWWLPSRARVARFNHNDIDQALHYALEATKQDDRSSPFARSWIDDPGPPSQVSAWGPTTRARRNAIGAQRTLKTS